MNLSPRRQRALESVQEYIPDNVKDWNSNACRASSWGIVGIPVQLNDSKDRFVVGSDSPVQESKDGITPEEAFFMRSETGKFPPKVTDLGRLVAFLWGQRWMATMEKMWREGKEEGTCFLSDFDDEPEHIREFVTKRVFI